MIGKNLGIGADGQSEPDRSASVKAALRNISEAMPLLDQAGHDVAAAHLQAAFDVLSGRLATEMASPQ